MKFALAAVLLSGQAQAALIGVVPLVNGASIRLHDDPGICVAGARRAEYTAIGKEPIAGCWAMRQGAKVNVVFLDCDAVMIPVELVRKPEEI